MEQCDDGHSSSILEECASEETCHPDLAACVPPCAAEADCGPGDTCDLALGLCRPFPACDPPACPDGEVCVESSVCVAVPDVDASTGSGVMDLDCFRDAVVAPPSTPATCDISGRVYLFPSSNSEQTVGLKMVLRPAGDPATEVAAITVEEDPNHTCPSGSATPCGLYQFSAIPTNTVYDIEIQAGTSSLGKAVVTTIHAGVALQGRSVQRRSVRHGPGGDESRKTSTPTPGWCFLPSIRTGPWSWAWRPTAATPRAWTGKRSET